MNTDNSKITSWKDGSVIFELTKELIETFEIENISKKAALEIAVKTGVNLIDANLGWAELERADLKRADLGGAYLGGAKLERADLRGARLEGADLSGAYLERAYLGGANLKEVESRGAYLKGAALSGACLEGANLSWADLRGVCLSWADLRRANLEGADLGGACLAGANFNKKSILPCGEKYIPITKEEAHNHHKSMWGMLQDTTKTKSDYPALVECRAKWPNLPSDCFLCLFYRKCEKCPLGKLSKCDDPGSWWKVYNNGNAGEKKEAAEKMASILDVEEG